MYTTKIRIKRKEYVCRTHPSLFDMVSDRVLKRELAVFQGRSISYAWVVYETHLITQSSNPSSHRSRFMLPLPTRRYQVSKYWSKLIDKKSFQHLERENWGIVVILFFNADVDSPPVRGFLREAVPKIVDVWRVTSLFFTTPWYKPQPRLYA